MSLKEHLGTKILDEFFMFHIGLMVELKDTDLEIILNDLAKQNVMIF